MLVTVSVEAGGSRPGGTVVEPPVRELPVALAARGLRPTSPVAAGAVMARTDDGDTVLSLAMWNNEYVAILETLLAAGPDRAFQASGAWCAIADRTPSSAEQISARHRESDAACDALGVRGGAQCQCPVSYRP